RPHDLPYFLSSAPSGERASSPGAQGAILAGHAASGALAAVPEPAVFAAEGAGPAHNERFGLAAAPRGQNERRSRIASVVGTTIARPSGGGVRMQTRRRVTRPPASAFGHTLGAFVLISLSACGGQPSENEAESVDRVKLGVPVGQWPTYGGGPYNQNYSPL